MTHKQTTDWILQDQNQQLKGEFKYPTKFGGTNPVGKCDPCICAQHLNRVQLNFTLKCIAIYNQVSFTSGWLLYSLFINVINSFLFSFGLFVNQAAR